MGIWQKQLGKMVEHQNLSQHNPGLRPVGSPCIPVLTPLYIIAGEEDLDQDQLRRPPVPQHGRSTLDAHVGSGDGDTGPPPSTGDPRLGSRYHGGCLLEVDFSMAKKSQI